MPTKTQQAVIRAQTPYEKFLNYLQDASEWLTRPVNEGPNPAGILASQLGSLDPTTLLQELKDAPQQRAEFERLRALPREQAWAEIMSGKTTLPMSYGVMLGGGANAPLIRRNSQEVLQRLLDNPEVSAEIKAAATKLQSLYPRLFGHLEDVALEKLKPTPLGETLGEANSSYINPKFTRIGLSPTLQRPESTLAHELTHAKQRLLDPQNFGEKYLQEHLRVGYEKNPYETAAESVANSGWHRDDLVQTRALRKATSGLTPDQLDEQLKAFGLKRLEAQRHTYSPEDIAYIQQDPAEWVKGLSDVYDANQVSPAFPSMSLDDFLGYLYRKWKK